jgi:hypothetical protein
MSNVDVWSNQRWSTASSMTLWHHLHSTVTKNCQKLTQLWQCYGVRVPLYAYVPHLKVLKHFIYVHYGCGKQSMVVYSLKASTMTSWHHFHLTVTKNCRNLTQLCQINNVRVYLYAYLSQWKMLKHFYIYPLWMCEAIKGSLEPQSWHHGIISTWHHP